MIIKLSNYWDRLRASYWFLPSVMAIAAAVASYLMAYVDESFSSEFIEHVNWIYTGGPEGARAVLSAIASSVMGVAGTTFSILIAVLSLTSGQFGPRLLRSFMRDTGNQLVLGTFTATFLYCLLVLRTIRGTEAVTFVPHFSVTVGVLLAILCVGVLIYFIHHVADSIQVSHLIADVGIDADIAVNRTFLESDKAVDRTLPKLDIFSPILESPMTGYLESIDEDFLFAFADKHKLILQLEVRPGEYVLPQMNLLSASSPLSTQEAAKLSSAFSCGIRRTMVQDTEFAFLQLSEIAVRALSPGINDPFTAMMCLDRITASLCLAATKRWPSPYRYNKHGELRLISKLLSAEDLTETAYGHIKHAAKDSPAVLKKLECCINVLVERAFETNFREILKRLKPNF